MIRTRHLRAAVAACLLGSLAACATTPRRPHLRSPTAARAPMPSHPAPADRLARASALLGRGEPAPARAELIGLLQAQPASPPGRLLLDQIDMDPRALLGDRNFSYVVKPGETFYTLAARFLGDRRLFYGLARYNHVEVPDDSIVGRTVLIPGAPRGAPVARRRPPPVPPAAPPAIASPAPAMAANRRDPVGARHLRVKALEAMNGGRIDTAVALLQRARQLDPASSALQDDHGR
ncbi:MAG: hypothetical protein ACYC8V_10505, partial [Caulobacteraceae bacterium]